MMLFKFIMAGGSGLGGGATPPPSSYTSVQVISGGESNSGGQALTSQATTSEVAVSTKVKIWNPTTAQREWLDIGTNNNLGHYGISTTTQHGYELQTKNKAEAGDFGTAAIDLTKCGQGGSPVSAWAVGGNYNGVACYQTLKDRATAHKAAIIEESGLTPQQFLMFSLGINDMILGTDPATFKSAFKALLNQARTDLGSMPIFLMLFDGFTGTAAFNTVITEIASELSLCHTVSTAGCSLDDQYHLSYAGFKTWTDRFWSTLTANYTI